MTGRLQPPQALTILHLNHAIEWRGAERQTFWLSEQLTRRGHRSIIAAHPEGELAARASRQGLEVRTWPAHFGRRWGRIIWWIRALARRERVQIVHSHTARTVMFGVVAITGSAAKLVITRRVLPSIDNVASRWKYGRAAAIIAVSDAVARVLAGSGLPAARTVVIPSGIDLSRSVVPASRETLAALGVPAGARLVIMPAALDASKDPLTFVRAIDIARRSVTDLHVLLLGEGEMRAELEREVSERGLAGMLGLPGHRRDVDALLAAADVVALTSRREALGTVLLDALAFGRPIVATAAGGIPEIVEPAGAGLLVPVGDAEAFAGALVRVLTDPGLAQRIAAAGRTRAADFDVAEVARRVERVYRAVLTGEPLHDLA